MSRSNAPILVWFRDDLRLDDNAALLDAHRSGQPIVAFFCFEDGTERSLGAASRWWLHHSLATLIDTLSVHGIPLILKGGDAAVMLDAAIAETGADTIVWNRRYTAAGIEQDKRMKADLLAREIMARSFSSHLLHEPWTVKTGQGGPFRVFTPFSRAARAVGAPAMPVPVPTGMQGWDGGPDQGAAHEALAALNLRPTKPDWAGGLRDTWRPGPDGAADRLAAFVDEKLNSYSDKRDMPGIEATTRLSAHLRFGEISIRQLWHAAETSQASSKAIFKVHQELLWREFSYHLLYHYPDLAEVNYQAKFDSFPWADPSQTPAHASLEAWQKGLTGYPIVDAGMRELWHTGWMHNRVRMVVGSFLVKHLLIDWREGERWFWDTLVDAAPANNAASWQWVAGTGADAAPYFRVFNPILQGEKFDGDGAYTRRWVPELANMPERFLHKPWQAPANVLKNAGVRLGETYPAPIVDHALARDRALEAFKSLPKAATAA
ncbi:MAG: cryptochrome/photolyase family protein [Cohaesibacteraceae bacterium]